MPLTTLPTVQMLWIEGHLSTIERLSIASYLAHGYAVHLYHYRPVEGVPDGVELRDAKAIVPEAVLERAPRRLWGVFSDIFRYNLLHKQGGIWSDADVVLLKPVPPALEKAIATEFNPQGVGAVGCFLMLPKGSDLAKECIKRCGRIKWDKEAWGTTGPVLLSKLTDEWDLYPDLLPPTAVCPVPYWQVRQFVSGDPILLAESFAVHLYNERWRQEGLDREASHHPHSLFERLKRRYL